MSNILKKAIQAVDGDRQSDYGDPVENFVREALVVAGMMGKMPDLKEMVAVWMSKKVVRAGRSTKEDTKVDIAGYAEIMARIERAVEDGTVAEIVRQIIGPIPMIEDKSVRTTVITVKALDGDRACLYQKETAVRDGDTIIIHLDNITSRHPHTTAMEVDRDVFLRKENQPRQHDSKATE